MGAIDDTITYGFAVGDLLSSGLFGMTSSPGPPSRYQQQLRTGVHQSPAFGQLLYFPGVGGIYAVFEVSKALTGRHGPVQRGSNFKSPATPLKMDSSRKVARFWLLQAAVSVPSWLTTLCVVYFLRVLQRAGSTRWIKGSLQDTVYQHTNSGATSRGRR